MMEYTRTLIPLQYNFPQVRHLLDTGETRDLRVDMENVVNSSTPKLTRNGG